ncbi:hypothetical protein ACPV3A_16835 [Paenibacillus sp. Dod16]|uniref:hypothetical protein n=1 Tax=Paenibacillus sp. Dod16 TaxID=3416392 RepID=UPI003CF8BFAB
MKQVKCNRCENFVLKSKVEGYTYSCDSCEEELYTIETYAVDVSAVKWAAIVAFSQLSRMRNKFPLETWFLQLLRIIKQR